jgi:hypothetical protein
MLVIIKKPSLQLQWRVIITLCLLLPFAAGAQQLTTISTDSTNTQQTVNTHAHSRRAQRKQLLAKLKQLNLPDLPYNTTRQQQWGQMANLFTHLRLYPLAMKCFLKTLPPDSLVNEDIPISSGDGSAVERQIKQIGYEAKPLKCNIIKVDSIRQLFQDGKQAMAYAMILHVKQPVRGKAKVHQFINTGHTFITLIKFNTDSSYTTMSFGFGPHKDNLLAATPIVPTSTSKFTDDSGHEWDEVVGKFISKRRFDKILQLTKQYDGLNYNLSTNNCTDFGLKAAELAGIQVRDTKGTWPMGAGNNPGITGESILLGKFSNADTGNTDRLFIDTTQYVAPAHKVQ